MSGRSYIVSQYPLSTTYMERFGRVVAERPDPLVVSNITANHSLAIIRQIRALRADTLYLPVVDHAGRVLLPLLKMLCLAAGARRTLVVEPDLSTRAFGLLDGLLGVAAMGGDVAAGLLTVLGDRFRVRRLLAAPRIVVSAPEGQRVLYLKTNLWLGVQAGGSVAHTAGVIGGLLNRGYAVDFASAETPVALPDDDSLTVHRVNPPQPYVLPREVNHYRHNANFVQAAMALRAGPFGFIYQRLSQGNYTGVMLSRLLRLPLVMEYNGSEVWLARNWGRPLTFARLAEAVEAVCLRHAHLVMTVSDVLRDELVARGVEPGRVVSYPNGVDPSVFDPGRFSAADVAAARTRFGIPEDAVVVTFVGTFGHWHGAEVLARTLRRIADSDSEWLSASRAHVVFIGDGVKRPLVEDILSDPAVRPFCTITGLIAQEEAPLYMAASDILVSPHVPNPDGSPFFGSPTKLFEYLAAGRPVVGSDLFQIGAVLRGCPRVGDLEDGSGAPPDGACGILVEPEDTAELAAAIRFLVDNPAWRRAAGANARRRVLDRYTWDHHVAALTDGLDAALARDAEAAASRRPLRLLVNGLHSKSGGGVTYMQNMLRLFAAAPDVDVHLCIHEDQRDLVAGAAEDITVHVLPFKSGFWRLLVREQWEVPRLARRLAADVTFSPANYGPLFAPNTVILLRNAINVAFVEHRPVKLAYWAMVYVGTALSLMVSRKAVAVSDYARRAVAAGLLGAFRDRITVIPHGVGEPFSPNGATADRDDFVLAVSDLYIQKNLKNLLRAFAHLGRTRPATTLKIAGRPLDVAYYADLRQMVVDEGLRDRVQFLGHVPPEDLAALYRRCAVFVFPSTVETFGNPLVEAMACGAPIASSRAAAMPEVLGDAAVYFDPGDVAGMAGAMDKLLADPELGRSLGQRAAARARAFSWSRTAARTLDVIREVVADS